jgi:hypothetical protein
VNGFQPKIGDKLTLVLAAGGVSGQFAHVLDPFSPLLGLELVYQPNSVVLEFASDFTAFAGTPNQRAVAAQLDSVDGQVGRNNYDSHAVIASVHMDF